MVSGTSNYSYLTRQIWIIRHNNPLCDSDYSGYGATLREIFSNNELRIFGELLELGRDSLHFLAGNIST